MTKIEEFNLILYEEIAFGIDRGASPKETVERVKFRLADMGCGFKVERELPFDGVHRYYRGDAPLSRFQKGYQKAQQDMLKAGYVIAEPLIKE